MHIEFTPREFSVSSTGELEYHGPVIEIKNEYRYMSKEQKLNILITLINWANDQIENI